MGKKKKYLENNTLTEVDIQQLKNLLKESNSLNRNDDLKRYIQKLEEHKKSSYENKKYSQRRFDVMIVSLSSAGIISSLSLMKDFSGPSVGLLIKISLTLFGLAIISNLVSQITAYFSNGLEARITTNIIRKERGKLPKGNQEKLEQRNNILNNFTLMLNGISLFSFIIGLIIIITFVYKTF